MGFRKQATLYKLKFEDPDMEGLVVVARSLPLKDFLEINRLGVFEDDPGKQAEQSELVFKKFAGALVEWNLETEEGEEVPATYDGIASQELSFILTIIRAWMEAIGNIPKPSQTGSNGSGTFPEQSIPMAVS